MKPLLDMLIPSSVSLLDVSGRLISLFLFEMEMA